MRATTVAALAAAALVLGTAGWVAALPGPNTVMAVTPGSTSDTVDAAAPPASADSTTTSSGQSGATAAVGGVGGRGAAGTDSNSASATGTTAATAPTAGGLVVDEGWLLASSRATSIPVRALQAYATAALRLQQTKPSCGLSWNTIAAIGDIESGHGTHGGASIGPNGQLVGTILGPVLDGHGTAAIPDSDHGALDGNSTWDRAVGPMQFLPSTWALDGVDGNGDGKADLNQIDDAALTTADYLCTASTDLGSADGWTAAILAYNHDNTYVISVRTVANRYATEVRAG